MANLPIAVIDANVLAPLIKRRVLMAMAEAALFRPVISAKILAEAGHTLDRLSPETRDWGERDLQTVQATWLMVSPDDTHDTPLPDEGDKHVLGAALAAGAELIITENIRDFPKKRLSPLGVVAETADRFVLARLETAREATLAALSTLPESLNAPFLTPETLPQILRRAGFRRVTKAWPAP